MVKLIASMLVVFMASFSPAPSLFARTSRLSTVGREPAPCVSSPTNKSLRRGSTLRFTNFCQDRVFINVCVRYSDGTSKLYSSGRRIQTGGFMNIFTDPFNRPVDFTVAYGIFEAEIPAPCQAPT